MKNYILTGERTGDQHLEYERYHRQMSDRVHISGVHQDDEFYDLAALTDVLSTYTSGSIKCNIMFLMYIDMMNEEPKITMDLRRIDMIEHVATSTPSSASS